MDSGRWEAYDAPSSGDNPHAPSCCLRHAAARTTTRAPPVVTIMPAPHAKPTIGDFFQAWKANGFADAYAGLSQPPSRKKSPLGARREESCTEGGT